MEIVAPDAASQLPRSVAQETLREMAAVVRTVFGVALHGAALEAPPAPPVAPAPIPTVPVTPLVPRPAAVQPAGLPVPGLPVPGLPVPAPAAALVVPGLPALPDLIGEPPTTAPERQQPLDRHSLSLLQEIAFLDD